MSSFTPMTPEAMRDFEESERRKTAVESAYFEQHRDEWASEHAKQWALIKGPRCVGFFSSFEDAYHEGDRLFGDQPIFIKQIRGRGTEAPLSLGLLHGMLVVGD